MNQTGNQIRPMVTRAGQVRVIRITQPYDGLGFNDRINAALQEWDAWELLDLRFVNVSAFDGGELEPVAFIILRKPGSDANGGT